MKKGLKLLLTSTLLFTSFLAACGGETPSTTSSGGGGGGSSDSSVPTGDEVTVYLNLGKIGLYDGKAGEEFKDVFLENAIKFVGKPGDPLPGADKITSTSGAKFVSWMSYDGGGAPTKYTEAPFKDNMILLANFEGGSGGGGGGGGGGDTGTYTASWNESWVRDADAYIVVWAWQGSSEGHWLDPTSGQATGNEVTMNLEGVDHFILVRFPSGTIASTADWANKWNQSSEVEVASGNTSYTVTWK